MPQTKTIRSKNTKKAAAPRIAAPEEDLEGAEISFVPKKVVKPAEIELDEAVASPEKLEEVSPFGETPAEEEEDEAGLDEEEINPFGDKWEV